ncbi:glycosyl hydrolase [Arachidicoccus ginsenosidimutans]|uniref:glycoside hydrolase family 15 protein n=1 Tax=Arachidicoccus sp. BS20 TaxID=1850526 RepID=UPI0007F0607F|nr:glycoside hydrolase family 15 protein [Arachidicoccus sp. BS20]ANI89947.1 glycosyl hydrolase [Arachidicoccus sp. BS20]
MSTRHIYQSGIIGNCAYIAHVQKDTNISWLCLPAFDSSFVFGSKLDKKAGGEFSILPDGKYTSEQRYLPNTNVLETTITNDEGAYKVTDFAPRFRQYGRYFKPLMLIRKVEKLSGMPRVRMRCYPVTDYGRKRLARHRGSNHIEFSGGTDIMRLTTNAPVSHFFERGTLVLYDTIYLVLTYGEPLEAPLENTVEHFLLQTINYWQRWIKHTNISNLYQDAVIRSALALKIHQYEDTGAIIAASTTSLPEYPGSGRNWDYRYCWLRDSYYVLSSLLRLGHFEEMELYAKFLANISANEPGKFQPLYSITGKKKLEEEELSNLSGYMDNQPVRIGNQAYEHIQNDVYGQMLLTLLPLYTDSRFVAAERSHSVSWLESLVTKIEQTIDEKDAGIWEFRNFANHHCYTNLFQWAGSNAAAVIARKLGDRQLEKRAQRLTSTAAKYIEACYDPSRKVYTHAVGKTPLDASTLQLIVMNYLDPSSQKAKDHLAALEKELRGETGLFYRYLHADDFGKPKSTFLICAFWYIEALASVGRLDDAIETFENLLGYANHLLLFSEDVDAANGDQWGNFPQAYSHVGLINAVSCIATKLDKPRFLV